AIPILPPKRLRNLNSKVLEQRKHGLEMYLQKLWSSFTSPHSIPDKLRAFLEAVDNTRLSWRSSDSLTDFSKSDSETLQHRPMVTFPVDSLPDTSMTHPFSDIVVAGVLEAMYDFQNR